jgi:hypothetical protein
MKTYTTFSQIDTELKSIDNTVDGLYLSYDLENVAQSMFYKAGNGKVNKDFTDFIKYLKTRFPKLGNCFYVYHEFDNIQELEGLMNDFFNQFSNTDLEIQLFEKLGISFDYIYQSQINDFKSKHPEGIYNTSKAFMNLCVFKIKKSVKFNKAYYKWEQEEAIKKLLGIEFNSAYDNIVKGVDVKNYKNTFEIAITPEQKTKLIELFKLANSKRNYCILS